MLKKSLGIIMGGTSVSGAGSVATNSRIGTSLAKIPSIAKRVPLEIRVSHQWLPNRDVDTLFFSFSF